MKINFVVLVGALTASSLVLPIIADELGDSLQSQPARDVARSNMMPRLGNLQRADRVLGADISDAQGKKIGTVKDLALDLVNGRIVEVIISTGGFLGDHHIYAIPPGSFSWDGSQQNLSLNITRDELKGVPQFLLSNWENSTEISQIKEVYQRYGIDPYFKDDQMKPNQDYSVNEHTAQDAHYYSFNGNNALPRLGYISRASKLMNTTVWSMQNEKLARVDNFMVDVPAGRAIEVIVGGRSILGADGELCAVPPQSFHWNADKTALTLDSTEEALKAAPHFRPSDYDAAIDPVRVHDVYARYHVEPYFAPSQSDAGVQTVRERTDNKSNATADRMNMEKMNSGTLAPPPYQP